jgi:hypothetical protein
MANGSDDRLAPEIGERSKDISGLGWISPTCPHCGKLIFPWLVERRPKRHALLRAALLLCLLICGADFLWDVVEMIRGVSRF